MGKIITRSKHAFGRPYFDQFMCFLFEKKMLCVIKLVGHYHFIYLTIYDVEAQNKPHYVDSLDGFMEVVLV